MRHVMKKYKFMYKNFNVYRFPIKLGMTGSELSFLRKLEYKVIIIFFTLLFAQSCSFGGVSPSNKSIKNNPSSPTGISKSWAALNPMPIPEQGKIDFDKLPKLVPERIIVAENSKPEITHSDKKKSVIDIPSVESIVKYQNSITPSADSTDKVGKTKNKADDLKIALKETPNLSPITSKKIKPVSLDLDNYVYITRYSVNIREGPGLSYKIRARASKPAHFTFVGISEGKYKGRTWYKIRTKNNSLRYVWSGLAIIVRANLELDYKKPGYFLFSNNIGNLRSGPGLKYSIIGKSNRGNVFNIKSVSNNLLKGYPWYQIQLGTKTVWAWSDLGFSVKQNYQKTVYAGKSGKRYTYFEKASNIADLEDTLIYLGSKPSNSKLITVYFDYNDDSISSLYSDLLVKNRSLFEGSSRVRIIGFTDSIGSESFNRKLSFKRAHSVFKALQGISTDDKLSTWVGNGIRNTFESDKKKRRVDILISFRS